MIKKLVVSAIFASALAFAPVSAQAALEPTAPVVHHHHHYHHHVVHHHHYHHRVVHHHHVVRHHVAHQTVHHKLPPKKA
jgi:Spy/CpxP family protein refolding chaperone